MFIPENIIHARKILHVWVNILYCQIIFDFDMQQIAKILFNISLIEMLALK